MAMNWTAALALSAALVAACGGGADRNKAQVRLVNASAYAQMDLRVDDELRQSQVGYAATEGYVEVDPGKTSTISSSGSATSLLTFVPSQSKKRHYTLLAYGPAGDLRQQQLDEDMGEPDTNRTLVRVINTSTDAGALDVYLTGANESVDSTVPLQAAASYGALGNWITVNSGTWRLQVAAAGSKKDLRLDLPALALGSKQVVTLVLTPGAGGVLVNALLLVQQGSITRLDVRHARVRLAALVSNTGTVAASVGTVNLSPGVGSPVVGSYVLVPSGVSTVSASVNGQSLAASSKTLDAGNDYTFMVHGPLAGARQSWVDDDNHWPTDNTRVKLRLVNALADGTAPLAMSLDALPVASGVQTGFGSAYFSAAPTSGVGNGVVTVTGTGLSAPVLVVSAQVLAAKGIYSVFAHGPQAAAQGIVRADR
jgi:hypothetical protein